MMYDSKEARDATDDLFENYAYHVIKASNELSKEDEPILYLSEVNGLNELSYEKMIIGLKKILNIVINDQN